MSDSASSSVISTDLPPESDISKCLFRVVRDALKKGEEITTRQARSQAEAELGLDDGFFKNDARWNAKSKEILSEAAEAPDTPKKSTSVLIPGMKRKSEEALTSKKRQKKTVKADEVSDETGLDSRGGDTHSGAGTVIAPKVEQKSALQRKPPKAQSKPRSRKDVQVEDLSMDEKGGDFKDGPGCMSPKTAKGAVRKQSTLKKKKSSSAIMNSSDEDEQDDSLSTGKNSPLTSKTENFEVDADKENSTSKDKHMVGNARSSPGNTGKDITKDDDAGNESEYSVVLDDVPARKVPPKKAVVEKKDIKSKPAKQLKVNPQGTALSADDEEVKRLQGWLIKCGIRKLWHKELADYTTSKEKIKHLKGMLNEAGMTGRYSAEKAKSIKEARELAIEIEAAQEFNKRWGENSGDEDEDSSKDERQSTERSKAPPAHVKRLPKGLVDFGDDDDSE